MTNAPDSDMQLLEAALRDIAPSPDPAFERDLDRRVDEGFPRAKRWRPPLIPALAAACVLVAIAVAGVALLGDHSETGVSAMTATRPAIGAAAPDMASTGPSQRKVERSVGLTLATARGKLAQVASQVGEVTSSHGGYVLSSVVSTGADGTRTGSFTVRIPSDRLEPALADLSALGEVRQRNETSQDLTAPFNHVQDKLGNDLLERRATADRLRGATGAEADRLRARLRALSGEIRTLNSRLRALRRRTALSTVNVHLEEKVAKHTGGIAGGGPGAAFDDAVAALAAALNVAIRLLPLAFLVLLGRVGLTAVRRRRREAALF